MKDLCLFKRYLSFITIFKGFKQAFRGDRENSIHHSGLRLRLSDFACEELTDKAIRSEDREILLSAQELFQLLAATENRIRGQRKLVKHSILPGVKKRKRSETVTSDDEGKYIEQEERADELEEGNDPDHENKTISSTSSDS